MTETEKVQIRKMKAEAAEWLRLLDLSRYRHALDDTDKRIRTYAELVIDAPEDHNLYEILELKRFFNKLDRYEWRPKRVKKFFKFYEMLKFNGTRGRQRYRLTPVQCFQFANIFGFANPDGTRLVRDAYFFVPRKFSKTTSAASLAVYDVLFGDNNAQAYVGSNSYEQSKICFNEIRAIFRDIDPSESHFRINREKIMFKAAGHDSFARCLTSNAKTQDGLNASVVIMDEYAQARDTSGKGGADLKNVLTSSMGARRQPLTLVITTASEVIDGPFAHELEGVKRVLRGELENDSMFASIFEPDIDDKEDDPHTWAKVQPHLGVTVQPNYYEKEWARAQLSAENMLTFRTKLLNIFAINEEKCWITPEVAKRAHIKFDPTNIDNSILGYPEAMCAVDLSEKGDFTAVSIAIYHEELQQFWMHTKYFLPDGVRVWDDVDGRHEEMPYDGLIHSDHENRKLYQIWADAGHLTLTHGEVVDYDVVAHYIYDIAAAGKITMTKIGYDDWKSTEFVNRLAALGGSNGLAPVGQTYGEFTSPCRFFEHAIHTGHLYYDQNPITDAAFANAILDIDKLGNCKPFKRNPKDRIDGLITMLMTTKMFIEKGHRRRSNDFEG